MSSHTHILQEKALQMMQSIGQNIYLKSIMSGMMLILPVTIMSSVATLIKVFPFAPYQDFLLHHNLTRFFDIPITFTNNFLAVIVAFSVAYGRCE